MKKNKSKKKSGEESDSDDGDEETIKLRMSFDIMKRIQFDPKYNTDEFTVIYLDRFIGMEERDFDEFLSGEIPYHRVYQIKLNGNIVWDRKLKKDLISDGSALQFVKEKKMKDMVDDEEDEKEVIEKEKDVENLKIIFSRKKNREMYKQYNPKDEIEKWMLRNNEISIALIEPTHISQLGGYYHIKNDILPILYKKWERSILNRDMFYMEEFRTKKFRLYLDFDFKTTNGKPFNIIEWIPQIQYCVNQFFSNLVPKELNMKLNTNVLVTESHSKWSDSVTTEANYKSGFRFYYTFIYVDVKTMEKFTKLLGTVLKSNKKTYPFCPKGWEFSDIVDIEQCGHEKVRMFGSTKHRRGKDLGRSYKLYGYFNQNGKRSKKFEKVLTLSQILYLSTVRSQGDVKFLKSEFKKLKVISFTDKEVSVMNSFFPKPKNVVSKEKETKKQENEK